MFLRWPLVTYNDVFRSLDVSTSHRDSHMFIGGEVYLARLIQSLPRLARLDLSGTNIAVQHEVPDHPDAMDTNRYSRHTIT